VCEAAKRHYVASKIVPREIACVVRNGIDISRIAAATERRVATRRMLDISPDAMVIGTVGRLNWAKNHALLIDSFALIAARLPTGRLLIVGDGELRATLAEQVQRLNLGERILLVGDRDDVPELLSAMDVFALTSTTEGYSVALLEAAAAGLPTVASDVGGNAEIVQHELTGCVERDLTPEKFANALLTIAANAGLRERLGMQARLWVERQGSITSMRNAYDNLYTQAAAKPSFAGAAL
jgi:glycosyltransferase involved in cell wall biosynthesis